MFVRKIFIGFLYLTFLPIVSISNSAFANMSATSESIVNGKIKLENACTKKGGKNLESANQCGRHTRRNKKFVYNYG